MWYGDAVILCLSSQMKHGSFFFFLASPLFSSCCKVRMSFLISLTICLVSFIFVFFLFYFVLFIMACKTWCSCRPYISYLCSSFNFVNIGGFSRLKATESFIMSVLLWLMLLVPFCHCQLFYEMLKVNCLTNYLIKTLILSPSVVVDTCNV